MTKAFGSGDAKRLIAEHRELKTKLAAAESAELDDKAFGDIIKEEINRINAKRGIAAEAKAAVDEI